MSATTNWKPAYDFTFTYGGTSQACESCEVSETVGTFDATNNLSGGYSEFGVDVETINLRWSVVVDDDTPALPTFKSLITFSYVDGIQTVGGSARITSRTRTGGAKGRYNMNFQAQATGAVTRT